MTYPSGWPKPEHPRTAILAPIPDHGNGFSLYL